VTGRPSAWQRPGEQSGRLAWGYRFLVCPPEHYTVAYEINPYMHVEVRPDVELAFEQFERLVATLVAAGATVERMEPVAGLPDLVFTANAGLVDGHRVVPSRFRHPERQGETAVDVAWFERAGFEVLPLGLDEPFEGAGDALPFGGASVVDAEPSSSARQDDPAAAAPVPATLLAGYRMRSSIRAHLALSRLLGVPVRSVELVDPRLYHLDLVFCPLDGRRALVAPQGLDAYGVRVVADLVPEPIWLEDHDAERFVANSVVVGRTIVMPACSRDLERRLRRAGFEVEVVDVGEFEKAGGACRCLTLALDMVVSEAAAAARASAPRSARGATAPAAH
jgi:N-dimethylarginine dimethylaminohydrolase